MLTWLNLVRVMVVSAVMTLLPLQQGSGQQRDDAPVLTNQRILQMKGAGKSQGEIAAAIRHFRPGFDVSSSGLVTLAQNRVDRKTLKLMLATALAAHQRGEAPTTLIGLDETMTNEAVIRMVVGKVPKDAILLKVQSACPGYDISTDGIIYLTENKVPADVVQAVMRSASSAGPRRGSNR